MLFNQQFKSLGRLALGGLLGIVHCTQVRGEDTRRFVRSLDEFRVHVQLHRERVIYLGLEAHRLWPDTFGRVSESLVREFLRLHDLSKVDNSPSFRAKFWLPDTLSEISFIERIYRYYGKDFKSLPEEQKVDFLRTISDLNYSDFRVAKDFFLQHGLWDLEKNMPSGAGSLLLRIEKIADVVDRNGDPVAREELGVKRLRPLRAQFDHPIDFQIAVELKKNHRSLAKGLFYQDCPIRLLFSPH